MNRTKASRKKTNSILDDANDTGLFGAGPNAPGTPPHARQTPDPGASKRVQKRVRKRQGPSSGRTKGAKGTSIKDSRGSKGTKRRDLAGPNPDAVPNAAAGLVPGARRASARADPDPDPHTHHGDHGRSQLQHDIDPSTITITTVNEKVSRRLAQHLWQQLPGPVLQALKDTILDLYVEPVVLQTTRSEKVRDRLRDLIQELVQKLVHRLGAIKLPVMKNPSFFNLETVLGKKLYLESVLSSNLKQIEILEKELIRFERIYERDLAYFNELSKTIARDDLVKDIPVSENVDHQLYNLKRAAHLDHDEPFDAVLAKLDRHLSTIGTNISDLTQLNAKVELVNDLLAVL